MGTICNVVSAFQQRLPDFCVDCDRNFDGALYINITSACTFNKTKQTKFYF